MKLSTLVIITVMAVVFVGVGPGVQALELDVEDSMSEFASEVRLLDEELRLLRNPFNDYRPQEETASQSSNSSASDDEDNEEEEEVSPPEFTINGMVRSGNRIILIIEDGESPELLKAGQSYDNYQFVNYVDGEATFKREGQEFNLQVGGGA